MTAPSKCVERGLTRALLEQTQAGKNPMAAIRLLGVYSTAFHEK